MAANTNRAPAGASVPVKLRGDGKGGTKAADSDWAVSIRGSDGQDHGVSEIWSRARARG